MCVRSQEEGAYLVPSNGLILGARDRVRGQRLNFLLQAVADLPRLCDEVVEHRAVALARALVSGVEGAAVKLLNALHVAAELGDVVLYLRHLEVDGFADINNQHDAMTGAGKGILCARARAREQRSAVYLRVEVLHYACTPVTIACCWRLGGSTVLNTSHLEGLLLLLLASLQNRAMRTEVSQGAQVESAAARTLYAASLSFCIVNNSKAR